MFKRWFSKKKSEPIVPKVGGLTDKTDYNAPKEIESDELVAFETDFYRNSDFVYDRSRYYQFRMMRDSSGRYTITEGGENALSCTTDEKFAARLQNIIRACDLIKHNGVHTKRAGIAPEYGPYWVKATYASGEQLEFYMNDDPNAKWTFEILDIFAKEFGSLGIKDLLPTYEDSAVTRFKLEYAYTDMQHIYSELLVPITEAEKNRSFEDLLTQGANEDDCVTRICESIWDRTGKTEFSSERMASITENYYSNLKKIIDDTELIYFQNGNIIPSDFDYEKTPSFYEFYVEFESGKRMSGYSDNPEQCASFRRIAECFAEFYNGYLEGNA